MLKNTITTSLVGLLLLASSVAHAGFVKTTLTEGVMPANTYTVLDGETGLEWLDLAATKNKSINEVKSLLNTDYTGYRLATYTEIRDVYGRIYNNLDIDVGLLSVNTKYNVNTPYYNGVLSFFNIFNGNGIRYLNTSSTPVEISGKFFDENNNVRMVGSSSTYNSTHGVYSNVFDFADATTYSEEHSGPSRWNANYANYATSGTFLVKGSVDVNAPTLLGLFSLITVVALRRKGR